MLFEDFRKYLEEKLLILGGGKKYGQAVILAGGAGSGKSFAAKHFMAGENYKIINVDDTKEMLLKLAKNAKGVRGFAPKLQLLLPQIRKLNMNNPDDTSKMHQLVKDFGLDDKQLFYILGSPGGMRSEMPNLMFDMTLKKPKDAVEVTAMLKNAGYKPDAIHIVWILTDYKMALQQNYHRDRRVFNDILFDTHFGARQTMQDFVIKDYASLGINGDLAVIIGGPKHSEMVKSNTGTEWAKNFTYFRLKKLGDMSIDPDAVSKVADYISKYAPPQQGFDSTIGGQFPQTQRR